MITSKDQIIRTLSEVPEHLLGEVLDFMQFLITKHFQETVETHLLSESVLGKDWLNAEEDQAWQDL
jgi:hypothetical protein